MNATCSFKKAIEEDATIVKVAVPNQIKRSCCAVHCGEKANYINATQIQFEFYSLSVSPR